MPAALACLFFRLRLVLPSSFVAGAGMRGSPVCCKWVRWKGMREQGEVVWGRDGRRSVSSRSSQKVLLFCDQWVGMNVSVGAAMATLEERQRMPSLVHNVFLQGSKAHSQKIGDKVRNSPPPISTSTGHARSTLPCDIPHTYSRTRSSFCEKFVRVCSSCAHAPGIMAPG